MHIQDRVNSLLTVPENEERQTSIMWAAIEAINLTKEELGPGVQLIAIAQKNDYFTFTVLHQQSKVQRKHTLYI